VWALFLRRRPDQLALIAPMYAMGGAIALAGGATLDLS
jgi:hypothetical protein